MLQGLLILLHSFDYGENRANRFIIQSISCDLPARATPKNIISRHTEHIGEA